jgi:hypothetical protein
LKYKHRAMRQQHLFTTGRSDCLKEPSMMLSELVPATGLRRESGRWHTARPRTPTHTILFL